MLGGGLVASLRPGMQDVSQDHYNAYTQIPCVLRFEKSNSSTTDSVTVTLTELSSGNSAAVNILFGTQKTQYCDITEILRCWQVRLLPSGSLARTCTRWLLNIEEFDANGDSLGDRDISLYAYDAREPQDAKCDTPLPDTFRMLADVYLANWETVCARATEGACNVKIYNQSGTLLQSFPGDPGDLYTAGCKLTYNALSTPSLVTVGNVNEYTARIVWEKCATDKAMLRWWSPTCGGYKSVAVELRGIREEAAGSAAYIKFFDDVWAAAGRDGLKARIPLCTMRDAAYYRDIFISDEVEMLWDTGVYQYGKRVRVTGAAPDVSPNGTADIDMFIQLSEVSSLW